MGTADRIKDIGPQPQSFDIERATKENRNYRSVAWSGRYLKVTPMSIPAGGNAGLANLASKILLGGHVCRSFVAYDDAAYLRPDHFFERLSFATVCGPNSISLAPEPRAADAH
jgi:hypothetical protein